MEGEYERLFLFDGRHDNPKNGDSPCGHKSHVYAVVESIRGILCQVSGKDCPGQPDTQDHAGIARCSLNP